MENASQVNRKTSVFAIVSLVLSLLIFIPLTGLVGLILGIIALVKIAKNKEELTGKGLAIAGTIIGGIRAILLPFFIIAIFSTMPIIYQARNAALETQETSNLRQCGIALYHFAKDNDGNLPEELSELIEKDYLAKDDISEEFINNIEGIYIYHTPGANLYELNSDDILVENHKYNIFLYVDGHTDIVNDE